MIRSCKEVTELASRELDGVLGWRGRLGLYIHLALCRHCRRYVRQLRMLCRLLRSSRMEDWLPGERLSVAARRRILEHFRHGD